MIDMTKRATPGVAADLSGASPDMVKKATKASMALSMVDLADLDIEIIVLEDGSYSMARRYETGQVQSLTDRTTGFALAADADGKVPLIPFDGKVRKTITLTTANAEGIVEAEIFGPGQKLSFGRRTSTIWPSRDHMGSTNLGGALQVARKIIQKSKRFTMVIVIGDGSPNGPGDPETSTNETIEIGKLGGFVKFVALEYVEWLDQVDNLERTHPGRRAYDNVSSVLVPDPMEISDLDFYKLMVKELPEHIERATTAGYLK